MEPVSMKQQPCFSADTVKRDGVPVTLVRGDTFTFVNADSKQTSMCKTNQPSDPKGKALCWVQAGFQGAFGWLPVGRGSYTSAFCDSAGSQTESFIVSTCATEALVQCRTVIATGGLDVYVKPCNSAAYKLPKHLDKCSQFDFIFGSKTDSICSDGLKWVGIR
jgi:hypothetical protein